MVWLLLLGIFGGMLTTVAGVGGGLAITLILAALWDPARALATTAPALLFGNAQRVLLFRKSIPLRRIWPILVAAALGSLVLGFAVAEFPFWLLEVILVVAPALGIARELGWLRWNPGPRSTVPAALIAGGMNAAGCGAGVVLCPLILASGIRGRDYIGAIAIIAVAMHTARLVGYGAGGLITAAVIPDVAILSLGVFLGNWMGSRARDLFSEKANLRTTYGVLVGCVVVGLAGLGP